MKWAAYLVFSFMTGIGHASIYNSSRRVPFDGRFGNKNNWKQCFPCSPLICSFLSSLFDSGPSLTLTTSALGRICLFFLSPYGET